MTESPLTLAQPEDSHSREEWEAATAAVLRKARRLSDDDADGLVWDKLTRTTLDGIAITPLGVPADLEGLQTSGRPTRAGAWDIRARYAGAAEKLLNGHALTDLDGGTTSLWVAAAADTDFKVLLDKVLLDLAPVVLDPQGDAVAVAGAFVDHAASVGYAELHPATNLGAAADSDQLVEVAELARKAGVLAVVADGTIVHEQGASDVQELAAALLLGVTALRRLVEAGLAVEDAAGLIEFRYAATDEQFPTIAKLRAARRLWARVLELSGVSAGSTTGTGMRQHVVTSRPMYTKYDPYVNMLRATVAAFAAGVGGADSVTVLPFDEPLGQPETFGRRIARNVSHLLIEESHVAKVADPAGGSYAVEKLTDDLAVAAWELFGRLDEGEDITPLIEATVAAREAAIAKRKLPITGVSEFPNLAEELPAREPSTDGADVRRYGASFEALRDEPASAHVFLATLGTVAQHTARATFASNLFAAGGIAVDVAGPTAGVEELVAAYAGQAVVCLAGADTAYDEWGADAAAALREAGAQRVIIAGKPVEYADDSCAMGVDALAFLTTTREALA
ncbi:methylmalonyl-CoA mutase family protein [Nocardioides montaniterrae]